MVEKAQWAMAFITYIAFCVGVVGIFLVYLTLRATRETIKVTREASDEQLAELRKTTSLEMQPYLFCERVTVETRQMDDDGVVTVKVVLKVVNNGKTPAHIEKVCDLSIGSYVMDSIGTKTKADLRSYLGNKYLAPKKPEGVFLITNFVFDPSKRDGVLDSVIGNVVVHYWDNFTPKGKQKATSFSFRWDAISRRIGDDPSITRLVKTESLRMQDREES